MLILAIVAAIAVAAGFTLSRKQTFRIAVAGTSESIVALRRLGTHNVIYDGKLLGRLSRSLVDGHEFQATTGNPAFSVVPSSDGETWDVKFIGGPSRRLSIKADGGGTRKKQKARAPAERAAPPPPPPLPGTVSRGGPPKIGR